MGSSENREGDSFRLTVEEWRRLGDVEMALAGIIRLLDQEGFDDASGAQELLSLTHRDFARLLTAVNTRIKGTDL